MLTKWLPRNTFEKYRNTVLNLRAHRKLGILVDCTSAPVTVCSSTCRREQEGVLLAGCWRVATTMRGTGTRHGTGRGTGAGTGSGTGAGTGSGTGVLDCWCRCRCRCWCCCQSVKEYMQ